MGGRNLARQSLTPEKLDALPVGTPVINANMDIFVRRADGRWEGEYMTPVTSTLHKSGPIRIWPHPVPVNSRGGRA
jgi:hypothetical protein